MMKDMVNDMKEKNYKKNNKNTENRDRIYTEIE